MADDLSRRAHAILTEAVEIDDASDRRAHVTTACAGNEHLARRVDALLGAADASSPFLERPALETAELPAAPLPSSIGGYTIVRALGAGGMATVYEATQENPSRRVALKVMRLALTHTSAVERFRFETDVLGRLRHPAVAQIYEAGAQNDGHGVSTPYFAMEFIPGALPITTYCDREGLPIEEKIQLFLRVCDAVHYGHTLGVIHRDIKPGNVLVGDDGRPKVIDFGVAKSTDKHSVGLTQDSGALRIIGTFNYMSPEQREGDEIDTRSDVYALGVLLYELLTGSLPHQLTGVPITDASRVVRERAIKRPSTTQPNVSADIDAVTLKALEIDRERRYATVDAFAQDLRRYLRQEPILARPASTLYQVRMFARRRRPLVLGAACVVTALIAGIAATSYMAIIATDARRATEARERELERVVEFQTAQLAGTDVPDMGRTLRRTLVERFNIEDTALADVNFTSAALAMLDEGVLERSRQAIDEQFANEPLLRARMLHTLAGTMNTLGLPERAEAPLNEALRIRSETLGEEHPDTLESMAARGVLLGVLGRNDEAVEVLRRVHSRRAETLGPEHPQTLSTASSLGGALRYSGQFDEAARVWERTLEARRRVLGDDHADTLITLNNIGVAHALGGNLARAEEAWTELLEHRRRQVGQAHPLYQSSLTNLGLLLHERGKLSEARELLSRSLVSLRQHHGDEHPSTLSTMGSLGMLEADLGAYDSADTLLRECFAGYTKVLGPEHQRTLRIRAGLASVALLRGRTQEALQELRSVLETQERVIGDLHPLTIESHQRLASTYFDLRELELAEAHSRCATERVEPAGLMELASSAGYFTLYANILEAQGRLAAAAAAQESAHNILVRTLGEDHERTQAAAQRLSDLRARR